MKAVRVLVTSDLLREALCLPSDSQIIGAYWNADYQVELIVEHSSFANADIDELKTARPTFKRQPEVVFVDWGVQDA